ncbi:MAG: hypothetical protein ACRDTE_26130 [Pseudonocardiaceae bacterium]
MGVTTATVPGLRVRVSADGRREHPGGEQATAAEPGQAGAALGFATASGTIVALNSAAWERCSGHRWRV